MGASLCLIIEATYISLLPVLPPLSPTSVVLTTYTGAVLDPHAVFFCPQLGKIRDVTTKLLIEEDAHPCSSGHGKDTSDFGNGQHLLQRLQSAGLTFKKVEVYLCCSFCGVSGPCHQCSGSASVTIK
uniref:Uncharacterized protein n=1 Tax=Amphimedon queenslandica TaxID=400682 RepID=A0A1X7UX82_AMPQE